MIFAEITKRNYMSESVTLKSYFYEVLIPSSQKNTSSPIEDILHHVSKYIFYEKACALQMFQSTHPHGVRPATTGLTDYRLNCFNPRTHTGCDLLKLPICLMSCAVSIHAPTRGATVTITDYPTTNGEFQSTHPHGVRPLQRYILHRL